MSDTINLDPDKILEKDLNKDNLWGTYLTTMQRKVISDVVNDFQRSEDLFGNMYAGYFSGTQTWEGGNNGTTDVYRGLRNGHRNGEQFSNQTGLSKPNILRGTPYHWMTAAEVYFLRAEGAMLKWAMKGEAKDLYNQGIRSSITLCGIQDEKIINTYLSDAVSKPTDYLGFKTSPKIASSSNITIAWEEGVALERKLKRIITQKWIAIYPLGQESWSEFRRTGYPKIFPIIDNLSSDISTNEQVPQIPFPESEYLGNAAEVEKAIILLGGLDSGATKLWWDAK